MSLRILTGSAVLAVLCGCVAVDRDARSARNAILSGNDAAAAAWSKELADESAYSRNLGKVEAGRIALLSADYDEASRRFRAAIDSAVDRTEASPKLKVGDLANTALASTVTDDRTREYYLSPYEVNLALGYGILAQIFTDKRDDALADARLAVYVQDTLSESLGADMASEPEGTTESAKSIIEKQNAALESMIAATRNSWENPLLWWLTGVLFEADGDADSAWQSYRKAAAIKPDCHVFAADAARAEKGVTPVAGKAKLIVIYEQGLVPQRESLKVPVPLYTGFSIDIPRYAEEAFAPEAVSVSASTNDKAAAVALDVRSLAARDLKEKLPGIIVRNLTRAAVQASVQAAANASGNDYAKLAVFAGNVIVSAVRRADTRSWVTLPAMQHVWCASDMNPGDYELGVCAGGRTISVKVPLADKETRILWIASTGNIIRGASATLGGKGAPVLDLNGKEIK